MSVWLGHTERMMMMKFPFIIVSVSQFLLYVETLTI
jgi:hypothetical protein